MWSMDLPLEPNHRRRLQDAVDFFLLTTTKPTIPGTTHTGLIFSHHNIKGLLVPNQKSLGPLPKKAHTPSESETSPSASIHMDASHSSRKLNLPDSDLTRLGSALPSRGCTISQTSFTSSLPTPRSFMIFSNSARESHTLPPAKRLRQNSTGLSSDFRLRSAFVVISSDPLSSDVSLPLSAWNFASFF